MAPTTPPPTRIAAIVLTYHPDLVLLGEQFRAVAPQVEAVLFVDNGTRWDASPLLAHCTEETARKAEFLWLSDNTGVGAGHNRGIEWARARGFDHVLILDQDSVPEPDMVSNLRDSLVRLAASGMRVAAVGPRYVDRYTGSISPFVRMGTFKIARVDCPEKSGHDVVETDFLISSGALIPLAALSDIGEMDETLFIDHVDTEWVFRGKARGYRTYGVCDAIMGHSLGTQTLRVWLGRWRNVPLHSPERHYYVFRNGVILMRRPYVPRRWISIDIVRLVYMLVFFTLFAPSRWRRLKLMTRGLWDGLHGVTGPLRQAS